MCETKYTFRPSILKSILFMEFKTSFINARSINKSNEQEKIEDLRPFTSDWIGSVCLYFHCLFNRPKNSTFLYILIDNKTTNFHNLQSVLDIGHQLKCCLNMQHPKIILENLSKKICSLSGWYFLQEYTSIEKMILTHHEEALKDYYIVLQYYFVACTAYKR